MIKPLTWLHGGRRSAPARCVCADMLFVLHTLKPELQNASQLLLLNRIQGAFGINTHRKQSPLDADMLHASSLCSLRSPSTYSAQTCFSLPPLNSLLSGRDQRSGTLTCPEGGLKDSPPPSPSIRDVLPPPATISLFCIHLSLLSSPGSPDNVQKELLYLVSDYFRLSGWINKGPAASCGQPLCGKIKKKSPPKSSERLAALL